MLKPAVHLCDWKQMTWSLCVVVVYPHCLQRILEVTACAFFPSDSPALTVCEGGYQGVHLFAQKPLGLSCCTTGFLASSETLCCCVVVPAAAGLSSVHLVLLSGGCQLCLILC